MTTTGELRTALAGQYTIERELGAGGMATVYLAEDIGHRRKVAIKVLHPELSAVLGPDRFLKEIEVTANLQHPHVPPLFGDGPPARGGIVVYEVMTEPLDRGWWAEYRRTLEGCLEQDELVVRSQEVERL
jgi:serine/threonine-protein kinase